MENRRTAPRCNQAASSARWEAVGRHPPYSALRLHTEIAVLPDSTPSMFLPRPSPCAFLFICRTVLAELGERASLNRGHKKVGKLCSLLLQNDLARLPTYHSIHGRLLSYFSIHSDNSNIVGTRGCFPPWFPSRISLSQCAQLSRSRIVW
eukprot:COSAG02_NODE_2921_length_7747_cov_9.003400_1_plen_150_part_00